MRFLRLTAAILVTGFFVTPAYADVPAYTFDVNTGGTSGTKVEFVVANYATALDSFIISQIGVFDKGADGLADSHDFRIIIGAQGIDNIYSTPSGNSAPITNGFRWFDIPNISVNAGSQIIFMMHEPNAMGAGSDLTRFDFSGTVIDSRLTMDGAGFINEADINSIPTNDDASRIFAGPNLLIGVIPEPGSAVVLGVCLIGAWMRRRRS